MALPRETIQSLVFLKLLVAGHMTLYVTRILGWFWKRPWPSAPLVWAYSFVWMVISGAVQVLVRRALDLRARAHLRHLARVHARLG